VWKSNCIPQPHLVRKLWAEQEDDDVARWALWTEFAAKTHVVTAPTNVTSLRAFFHEHRDMTRGETLRVLAVMRARRGNLKADFLYTVVLLKSWMTTDRAAQKISQPEQRLRYNSPHLRKTVRRAQQAKKIRGPLRRVGILGRTLPLVATQLRRVKTHP